MVGLQIGSATMESSMEIPQKIKNSTTYDPAILSKEIQNINLKKYMQPYVCCCVICNSQDTEAAQVLIDGQLDEEDVVHVHDGISLGHKE